MTVMQRRHPDARVHLIQMILAAFTAVFVQDALGETANGFANTIGQYSVTRGFLWWHSGNYDPDHRILSRPYSTVYFVSALQFLFSVYVPNTE